MDKLKVDDLGGFPHTLDDLEFVQNALTEALRGLASVWQYGGSDPVILAGLTGTVGLTDTTFTNGFVIVNGEVYWVDGAITVPNGSSMVVDITPDIDPNGDKAFEDLSTVSTYIVRKGVLKIATGGSNQIDLTDFISIQNKLATYGVLMNSETSWTNLPALQPGWTEITTLFGTISAKYKKNKIGKVALRGILRGDGNVTAGDVLNLPVGFRPAQDTTLLAAMKFVSGGTYMHRIVYIKANGDMSINIQAGEIIEVSLDGLEFYTT